MRLWNVVAGTMVLAAVGCSMQVETDQVSEAVTLPGNPCNMIFGTGGSAAQCSCTSATGDATINSAAPTTNFGAQTICEVDGTPEMSCLLKWNLTAIPSNATVLNATLYVDVVDSSLPAYSGKQLLRSWPEQQTSWEATTSSGWQIPGAKAASDRAPASLFAFSGHQGQQSAAFNSTGLAVVASWISSPAANYGVIISSTDSHRMGISTREEPNGAPRLCVGYAPAANQAGQAGSGP
jgi:hypothetical protein